jgi:nucleotidyltransferase/DNA polymerase involved in DNA repair
MSQRIILHVDMHAFYAAVDQPQTSTSPVLDAE